MIRGSGGTFLLKVYSILIGYILTLILARALGANNFGIYAYTISWIEILIILAFLGLDKIIIREVSIYKTKENWSLLNGIIKFSITLVLAISIILAIVSGSIGWLFNPSLESITLQSFWLALLLLPLRALTHTGQLILQGYQKVVLAQIPDILIRPLLIIILFLILLYIFNAEPTTPLAIGVHIAASAISVLISIFLIKKNLPHEARNISPSYQKKQWIESALPLLFVSGMLIINNKADILMLGSIVDMEAAGIYSIASKVSMVVILAYQVVSITFAPALAKMFSEGNKDKMQNALYKSAQFILYYSLPITVFVVIFSEWILSFFGNEFSTGTTALVILSIGKFIYTITGLTGILLIMTGFERAVAIGVCFATITNIILNSILIPYLEINGAALATALSLIVWNIILLRLVVKELGVNPTIFSLGHSAPTKPHF